MPKDEFLHTASENEAKTKIRNHLKKKTTCKQLSELVEGTIMKKRNEDMLSLDEINEIVKKIKFQRYKEDKV